jgi:hypothetical protein
VVIKAAEVSKEAAVDANFHKNKENHKKENGKNKQ